MVTPTGAALLAELVESLGPLRDFTPARTGFGLGTRVNKTRPNVLRAILGETALQSGGHDWETDTVAVLQTNLDDITPEILGHVLGLCLSAGALDAFHTPVQMKKNRPGVLLTILCAEADADKFNLLLLTETSAFGVRQHLAQRWKLAREFTSVETPYGNVSVKVGRLGGRVVQAAPEFESCKRLAAEAQVPLKLVYEAALRLASSLK